MSIRFILRDAYADSDSGGPKRSRNDETDISRSDLLSAYSRCGNFSDSARCLGISRKVAEMMSRGVEADVYIFGHCHKECTTSFMGR